VLCAWAAKVKEQSLPAWLLLLPIFLPIAQISRSRS
jgi:hypothetical protein